MIRVSLLLFLTEGTMLRSPENRNLVQARLIRPPRDPQLDYLAKMVRESEKGTVETDLGVSLPPAQQGFTCIFGIISRLLPFGQPLS